MIWVDTSTSSVQVRREFLLTQRAQRFYTELHRGKKLCLFLTECYDYFDRDDGIFFCCLLFAEGRVKKISGKRNVRLFFYICCGVLGKGINFE